MQLCHFRVHHLGIQYCPRRSTLSDANKRRSVAVFEAIYKDLYKRFKASLPDSRTQSDWFYRLYLIDSTTISLFKEILKNAGRPAIDGKRKGGLKVHTLMKADEDVPCLIRMTAAAKHDVPFIQKLKLPRGSIVVFDKGYSDYAQYELWDQQGVEWVTRLREGSAVEYVSKLPLSKEAKASGVLSDQLVVLGHTTHKKISRINARLVEYCDPETGKKLKFITNNYTYCPMTIASIYKQRWQIEMLFKRIKQNYPLNYFLGDNENAIKIQVWCALIADLLLKMVSMRLKRKWSFANLSSMVRIHLMNYVPLLKFLNDPDRMLINNVTINPRGPTLFDQ
tara:strand:- start:95 stop:1105 length:1011 start_codon:yes stop_codon:yes gene_type:complete